MRVRIGVRRLAAVLGATVLVALVPTSAVALFGVPGTQLTPSGTAESGDFGDSVAVSADGNTALVGGDHLGSASAVAVYVHSATAGWTQQAKLTPTDLKGNTSFGAEVALSADGNTALVGDAGTRTVVSCGVGSSCSSSPGVPAGVWVFVRSGSTWKQQGSALTAHGETGASGFGSSVALSADGSTAMIGAPAADKNVGATWVFNRAGATWNHAGTKLTVKDEVGPSGFGSSVALSWDGKTALIGGGSDGPGTGADEKPSYVGAAWGFALSGGTWKQQGHKLTAPGGVVPEFGRALAISGDGHTALIGGAADGGSADPHGAVWTYTHSASGWSAKGAKLVVASSDETVQLNSFGASLALSANGATAIVGGYSNGVRTLWIYPSAGGGWSKTPQQLPSQGFGFGRALAVTPGGDIALVGTFTEAGVGSAWIFAAPGVAVAAKPALSHVSPTTGAAGAQVTITGKNLAGAGAVEFGGVSAVFKVVSATRITATVPASAATGSVTVVTPHGSAATTFAVKP